MGEKGVVPRPHHFPTGNAIRHAYQMGGSHSPKTRAGKLYDCEGSLATACSRMARMRLCKRLNRYYGRGDMGVNSN